MPACLIDDAAAAYDADDGEDVDAFTDDDNDGARDDVDEMARHEFFFFFRYRRLSLLFFADADAVRDMPVIFRFTRLRRYDDVLRDVRCACLPLLLLLPMMLVERKHERAMFDTIILIFDAALSFDTLMPATLRVKMMFTRFFSPLMPIHGA